MKIEFYIEYFNKDYLIRHTMIKAKSSKKALKKFRKKKPKCKPISYLAAMRSKK